MCITWSHLWPHSVAILKIKTSRPWEKPVHNQSGENNHPSSNIRLHSTKKTCTSSEFYSFFWINHSSLSHFFFLCFFTPTPVLQCRHIFFSLYTLKSKNIDRMIATDRRWKKFWRWDFRFCNAHVIHLEMVTVPVNYNGRNWIIALRTGSSFHADVNHLLLSCLPLYSLFFFATGCSWNTSVSAFIKWNIVPNTFFAPHKLLDYSQFGHHTRYLHVLQLVIIPHFPLFPNDNYYFGSRTPCGFYSVNLMDYVCQFNSSQIFAQTLYAHFTHCDQLGIYFLAAVETNRRFGTRRWWTTGKIKVRFFFFQSKYSKATFLALFLFSSIF